MKKDSLDPTIQKISNVSVTHKILENEQPSIEAIALGKHLKTEQHLIKISFNDIYNERKSHVLERSMLTTSMKATLIRELVGFGCPWPSETRCSDALWRRLVEARPDSRFLVVTAPGWYEQYFVTRNQVYGRSDVSEVLIDEKTPEHVSGFTMAGTLEGWQRAVKNYPSYSSPLCVAISATFAAPLLRPLGFDSFAVNWFGKTSGGKSTIIRAAAAVGGLFEDDGYNLPTWGDTDAAFEAQAMGHRDCLFPVDETGDAERNDVPLAVRAKRWAFTLSRNRPRKTDVSYARAKGLLGREFRVIGMSSSETAMADAAAQVGRRRLGGEEVRLIDIPAEQPGSMGVFDGDLSDYAGVDGARRLADKIKADAGRYQGVAFDAYLQALFAHERWRARAKKEIRRFEKSFESPIDSRVAGRITKNFAVIWAGAALAIRYKVLPWQRKPTLSAISAVCGRAIKALAQNPADPVQFDIDDGTAVIQRLSDELAGAKLLRVKRKGSVSDKKVAARQAAAGFYIRGRLLVKNSWLVGLFNKVERTALKKAGAFGPQNGDTPTVCAQIYGIEGRLRYYPINDEVVQVPRRGK